MKSSVVPAAMRKFQNLNPSFIPHFCKQYSRILSCNPYTNRREIWKEMLQSYCCRQSQVKVQDGLVILTVLSFTNRNYCVVFCSLRH
jgi:hypothetical protein